jgi:UDP-N-acetylglucosamine transferase subunit ALG13
MIFVTVGTHHQGFDRLVQAADELAAVIDEQVIIQRGVSEMVPQHARHFEFCTMQEMADWIHQARVVVAQAGAGTIITTLQQGKPLVVTPRLKAYGENYTDHQIELASELDQQGRATMASELSGNSLQKAIQQAMIMQAEFDQSAELVQALRQKMNDWQPLAGRIAARLEKLKRRLNKHQLLLPLVPFFALAAYLRALVYRLGGKTRDAYGITTAYLPNRKYFPFDDRANTDFFQDEVYQTAQRFMSAQGLSGVLDVGCGSAYKLIKYFADEETLGLELPETLAFLQGKYPDRQWALSDFENPPQEEFGLTICSDVIEHLLDPDALLAFFTYVNCEYFLLSTPERGRLGLTARFRPRSPWHLREWTQEEFIDYLSQQFEVVESGLLGHHDQYVIMRNR